MLRGFMSESASEPVVSVICSCCFGSALALCAGASDGRAYRTDDGSYLLVMPYGCGGDIMTEFGEVFYTCDGYLAEHCSEICSHAVERLGALA